MLRPQDLVKTKFVGKHCVGFQYTITDNGVDYVFDFEKVKNEPTVNNAWKLYAMVPDIYSEGNKKLVQFIYGLPKEDMSLVKVASIGLQLVRGLMQREINLCTTIDFLINEQLEGLR